MSTGIFPDVFSQQILVGIILIMLVSTIVVVINIMTVVIISSVIYTHVIK